jgi:putative ABC transport system substrate-binding protein
MKRKITILTLCAMLFAHCVSAEAQLAGKVLRIGFLDRSTAGSAVYVNVFREELSKLGWIERKNITIEYRFAEGKTDRLPELAAELVRLKVDLIVATGRAPGLAAKSATTTIPIVMTSFPDPIAAGLVASLARPGGNVTGLSNLSSELSTKRLEILKDAVPKLARVGLLLAPGTSITRDLQLKELKPAVQAPKLKLEEIETQPDAKGDRQIRRGNLQRESIESLGLDLWNLEYNASCCSFSTVKSLRSRTPFGV